jgi:type 1 glutamine amidotransferase
MSRAVVLTGGADYAHDFSATGPELGAIAQEMGYTPLIVHHPDDLIDVLSSSTPDSQDVDVLIINALRWRMLADRHAQWRDEWAYITTNETRRVIEKFVADGGGLVGNHTAPICFDDWPEWGEILGGAWDWERSAHPPLGPISAQITGSHPITDGVSSPLVLDDEVYGDLQLGSNVQVLATAKRTPDDDDQPMVWAHTYGAGRVAYCCFGHDVASLRHVGVRRILHQSIVWAAHTPATATTPMTQLKDPGT